jgi:hypothetical protein
MNLRYLSLYSLDPIHSWHSCQITDSIQVLWGVKWSLQIVLLLKLIKLLLKHRLRRVLKLIFFICLKIVLLWVDILLILILIKPLLGFLLFLGLFNHLWINFILDLRRILISTFFNYLNPSLRDHHRLDSSRMSSLITFIYAFFILLRLLSFESVFSIRQQMLLIITVLWVPHHSILFIPLQILLKILRGLLLKVLTLALLTFFTWLALIRAIGGRWRIRIWFIFNLLIIKLIHLLLVFVFVRTTLSDLLLNLHFM